MGQFDNMGLPPLGKMGLTAPKNQSSNFKRVENKPKPKTAAAGTPPKPPKDSNKKEPNNKNTKGKPDEGFGGLVRSKK